MLPSPSQPTFASDRIEQHLMSRCNPLQGLNPANLGQILNGYRHGHLAEACELFEFFAERNIQVLSTYPKRIRAVSSLNWQVLEVPEADASPATVERHTQAVNYLLRNLVASRALKKDERGGVRKLISYLMEATLHGWSACELAWTPVRRNGSSASPLKTENSKLKTASSWAYQVQAMQIPTRFFEATTGELRFLEQDYALKGKALEAGRWIVHTAPALGPATATACMLQGLSLRDWIGLCELYGYPFVHGKTDAAYGSAEWNQFKEALYTFGKDGRILTNNAASIAFHNGTLAGQNPQQAIIDYLDKALAVLWRGGDLSTFSGQSGDVGANAQQKESEALEDDDALGISETIQHYLVVPLIRALYGEDPAVIFALQTRNRVDTDRRLKIYESGTRLGVPLSIADFREEFSLPSPGDEETELLKEPAAPAFGGPPSFVNAKAEQTKAEEGKNPAAKAGTFRRGGEEETKAMLLAAYQKQSAKLLARLDALPDDPAALRTALEQLIQELPELLPEDPAIVAAWEGVLAEAVMSGGLNQLKIKD